LLTRSSRCCFWLAIAVMSEVLPTAAGPCCRQEACDALELLLLQQ